MKRPRIMRRKIQQNNTGTLDSLDVDWKKEFDQKYADLIFKTEAKRITSNLANSTEERLNPECREDRSNLSFSSGKTYTVDSSPINEEDDTDKLLFLPNLSEMKEDQDCFEAKKHISKSPYKARKLSYSYHVLKDIHC